MVILLSVEKKSRLSEEGGSLRKIACACRAG